MERLITPELKSRISYLREKMLSEMQIDIENPSRKREYVVARTIIAEILHSEGFTFKDIGKAMEKNHSTIVHYIKIADNIKHVPGFSAEKDLRERFRTAAQEGRQ